MAKALKPPYASVSDVDAFFERVLNIAEPRPPKKVDSAWIVSYQFNTAHPAAIPSMLQWLGVINDQGQSKGIWNELRVEATRQTTLERLMKESYKAIFDSVQIDTATLRDIRGGFVSAYQLGDSGRQINCFLALCKQAGIKTGVEAPSRESKQAGEAKQKPKLTVPSTGKARQRASRGQFAGRKGPPSDSGYRITLNVEIPATWTEDQIRARIAVINRAVPSKDTSDS